MTSRRPFTLGNYGKYNWQWPREPVKTLWIYLHNKRVMITFAMTWKKACFQLPQKRPDNRSNWRLKTCLRGVTILQSPNPSQTWKVCTWPSNSVEEINYCMACHLLRFLDHRDLLSLWLGLVTKSLVKIVGETPQFWPNIRYLRQAIYHSVCNMVREKYSIAKAQ